MTIIERANSIYPEDWFMEKMSYIKGAEEQQKIDINKACEALYTIQDILNADLMDIEKAKDIMRKAIKE